jgi:hypothetical protein
MHQFTAYDNSLDLRRVCATLRDPKVRMAHTISLFSKFNPMLAKKFETSQAVTREMKNDFVIEDKVRFRSKCIPTLISSGSWIAVFGSQFARLRFLSCHVLAIVAGRSLDF